MQTPENDNSFDLRQRLRDAIQECEALLANIGDAVLVLDPESGIMEVRSKGALDPFQGLEQLPVTKFAALFTPSKSEEFLAKVRDVLAGTGPVDLDVTLPLRGKSARFMGKLCALESRRVLLVLHDVSEREQLLSDLLRLERLASLGQTAAGMAHEIRGPLASILGAAEMLPWNPDLESVLAHSGAIARQCMRIDATIKEALAYTRRESWDAGPWTELTLHSLLMDALKMAQMQAGEACAGVRVVMELPSPAPVIQGQALRLEQVLVNLISNAYQAMEGKGTLKLALRKDGDGVEIVVEDDGPGIRQEDMGRIWEPLFTTKADGTGLGLDICRKLVGEHHGSIEVQGVEPHGARFVVHLPNQQPGANQAAA